MRTLGLVGGPFGGQGAGTRRPPLAAGSQSYRWRPGSATGARPGRVARSMQMPRRALRGRQGSANRAVVGRCARVRWATLGGHVGFVAAVMLCIADTAGPALTSERRRQHREQATVALLAAGNGRQGNAFAGRCNGGGGIASAAPLREERPEMTGVALTPGARGKGRARTSGRRGGHGWAQRNTGCCSRGGARGRRGAPRVWRGGCCPWTCCAARIHGA